MDIRKAGTKPFSDQKPGTSGLRKKTRTFMQPGYVENFVQSVFNSVMEQAGGGFQSRTLVVGGDGRYFNREAIQTIIRIAVANGFSRILVGHSGILSTPAMSAVIRNRSAFGGLVLSASHNPAGLDQDFGIKYNIQNGGPSPENVTAKIFQESLKLDHYLTIDSPDVDLEKERVHQIGNSEVEIINSLTDYVALMQRIFDFESLRGLFKSGFRMTFDAMHGVTGPYAIDILERLLQAPKGTVVRGNILEDFGGHHPDPNLVHAADLVKELFGSESPDFGAACDGDGDRNMILGRSFYVTPGDSVAIIAQHAGTIPAYAKGLSGVARSMPTSTALDRVAESMRIVCHETPTGWKFFGNLMDADLCTICGEESFGTGSNHVREKDGIWAVLSWLSILAATRKPVSEVVKDHWKEFGRSYYQRHDYEGLNLTAANEMINSLREKLPSLSGTLTEAGTIQKADDFSYIDPVDGSISSNQGIRIFFEDGSRFVCRLSGTGTEGATLRIYVERYRNDGGMDDVERALSPLVKTARSILGLKERFGTDEPTIIT